MPALRGLGRAPGLAHAGGLALELAQLLERGLDRRLEGGLQLPGDPLLAGSLQCLDSPLLLLVAGTGLRLVRSAETEKTPVNRNVNVLREPFDDIESFRQRRATLKDQVLANAWQPKQFLQRLAHPEILFHNIIDTFVANNSKGMILYANIE